jgi:hypothetical protein
MRNEMIPSRNHQTDEIVEWVYSFLRNIFSNITRTLFCVVASKDDDGNSLMGDRDLLSPKHTKLLSPDAPAITVNGARTLG